MKNLIKYVSKFFVLASFLIFTLFPVVTFAQLTGQNGIPESSSAPYYQGVLNPTLPSGPIQGMPNYTTTLPSATNQSSLINSIMSSCSVRSGISALICEFNEILNSIVPILVALGVIYFVWGVITYFIAGGEEAKKQGRDRIIFGIIGLAVIVSLWGLVNIIVATFDIGGQTISTSSILDVTNNAIQTNQTAGQGAASVCSSLNGIGGLICQFNQILNSIIPVLLALGVVYFVWGVITYFIAGGEEAKKQGRDRIIFGIIGLAVIVSLWGLVNIVVTTFGLGGQTAPTVSLIGASGVAGSACTLPADPKFQDLMGYVTYCIINNSIVPLIFAVAAVMFVWGVVQYFIIGADEEAKREQGKQFILWGIIALAVMLTVWGLVHILGATFGVNTTILPKVKP